MFEAKAKPEAEEAPIEVPRLRDITHMAVVHGSIGAGKSTLLREMQQWARGRGMDALDPQAYASDRIVFIGEPIADWGEERYAPVSQKCTGCASGESEADPEAKPESEAKPEAKESLLGKYYAAAKRYAFLFQSNAFVTRLCDLAQHLARLPPPQAGVRYHVVCEGGMSRDWLFASMLRAEGTMEPAEWDTYERLFNATVGPVHRRESLLLYVPTDPAKCKERQLRRGRDAERNIPLSYLESLEQAHRTMMDTFPGPVLRLEAFRRDLDAREMAQEVNQVMERLLSHFVQ